MRVTLFPVCALTMCVLIGTQSARADGDLPTRPNFDRYNGMLEHSPFAVASAVVAPAAEPNFAKDLYVANAAKSPDGDMITIASNSDKEFKKYLTTKEPIDGYGIASIEWSDRVGETKVTISKDGQFATLTFNQALISESLPTQPTGSQFPIQPPGPPRPPIRPGQPPFPIRPGQQPAPIQTMPIQPAVTPIPHTRGIIQRNPAANQNPTPFVAPKPPQSEE